MTNEELDAIRAREAAATPGPWAWDIQAAIKQAYLWTTHNGHHYVMGFRRWGMNGAAPTFQVYEKYEGPLDERKSKGMFRADKLTKSLPGKEYNVGYDDYLDHPDAEFIAHARQDVPALIAEVKRLNSEAERLTKERDAAVNDLEEIAIDATSEERNNPVCKYCMRLYKDDYPEACSSGFVRCRFEWLGVRK